MDVEVDDAGQDVHARGVDLARGPFGTPGGIDRNVGHADVGDLGDAIPLDDDIDWAARRAAGAVDEGRAANDEPRERASAFVAIGREARVVALLIAEIARRRGVGGGGGALLGGDRAA